MAKILLVEDNEMNSDMLSRRLRKAGFEVSLAVDGSEALKMISSESFDLVLMDLNLPEIDGWETTRRIKSDQKTRQIPVIALSSHAMVGDRSKAMEAGCDDYDTKPVRFERLKDKIDSLLKPSRDV